jgi:hypothetical protein
MTAQIAEKMIYKGEELSLCDEPLHYYMQTIGFKHHLQPSGEVMSAPGRLRVGVCI